MAAVGADGLEVVALAGALESLAAVGAFGREEMTFVEEAWVSLAAVRAAGREEVPFVEEAWVSLATV